MFRTILLMMTALLMVTSAEAGPQEDCEQSHDLRRVISGCTQVLKKHPDDARVHTLRGYAYLEPTNPSLPSPISTRPLLSTQPTPTPMQAADGRTRWTIRRWQTSTRRSSSIRKMRAPTIIDRTCIVSGFPTMTNVY